MPLGRVENTRKELEKWIERDTPLLTKESDNA